MKVAVVGPRKGGDTEVAADFCRELYRQNPDIVLLSGGAKGIDATAEFIWSQLGGRVWSYRITQRDPGSWQIEKWEYGGDLPPKRYVLQAEPDFADPRSALFYRSMLVAEAADRVVGFAGKLTMRGTEFTLTYASDQGKPIHVWREGTWQDQ